MQKIFLQSLGYPSNDENAQNGKKTNTNHLELKLNEKKGPMKKSLQYLLDVAGITKF